MPLEIISDKCIACGKCYLNHPQLFDCDDQGVAFALPQPTDLDDIAFLQAAKQAIFACPTRAIIHPKQTI